MNQDLLSEYTRAYDRLVVLVQLVHPLRLFQVSVLLHGTYDIQLEVRVRHRGGNGRVGSLGNRFG